MNFNTFGGKRFALTIGAGIVSSLLLWFGKVASGDYAMIVLGTVGAYIAGSTMQQINLEKQTKKDGEE
jgi:uncharacterized membrane protein YeaQ/YmgE (transglycosylase-associated protein family)